MRTKLYKNRELTLKICLSAVCMALAFVLPFVTGAIPEIGGMLCPMHIPAFLLGIIAGPYFGTVLAFLAPILRSLMLGSPTLFPRAFTMAFELMAYALVFAIFYKLLPKKTPYLYVSLIASMLVGRAVGGIVKLILFKSGVMGAYSFTLFISGYFTETVPGVIIQILTVPPIVIALKKAKILK